MPAGRPTKLTPAIIKAAKGYLDNYEAAGDLIPSMAGLAIALNVAKSTIYKWSDEEGGEFSDYCRRIKLKQEQVLMNGGLSGDYNPTITKLLLTKHGYSDKQEVTGSEGADLFKSLEVKFK